MQDGTVNWVIVQPLPLEKCVKGPKSNCQGSGQWQSIIDLFKLIFVFFMFLYDRSWLRRCSEANGKVIRTTKQTLSQWLFIYLVHSTAKTVYINKYLGISNNNILYLEDRQTDKKGHSIQQINLIKQQICSVEKAGTDHVFTSHTLFKRTATFSIKYY